MSLRFSFPCSREVVKVHLVLHPDASGKLDFFTKRVRDRHALRQGVERRTNVL
jgi:hypothetical protein